MKNKQLITIFIIIAILSILAIALYSINHQDDGSAYKNNFSDRFVDTEHGKFDTVTGKHSDDGNKSTFDYYHSCISENGILMSSPEEAAEYDRTH